MKWKPGTRVRINNHPNVANGIRGSLGTVVRSEYGDWVKVRLDADQSAVSLWEDMIEVDVLGELAKL